MFGHNRLGHFRVAHAFLTLVLFVACGVSVWVRPSVAIALALGVCTLVLIGKAVNIANGQWRSCKRCILAGPVAVLAATAALALTLQ